MKRRDAIKFTAFSLGALLSSTATNQLIAKTLHVFHDDSTLLKPKHFSPEELRFISTTIDIIIPETDSPSATQVGVHFLMDSLLAEVFPENDKIGFMNVVRALQNHLASKDFLDLTPDEQLSELKSIFNKDGNLSEEIFWGASSIRNFAIDMYLASGQIGKEFLNYLPVPGYYDPCIDVSEVNNTRWTL